MKTQDFMKTHLDLKLEGGRHIMNTTAAYQYLSGSSDAELLDLALTWMCQMNMQAGWMKMISDCEKQRRDSNAAYEAEQAAKR